MQNPDGKSRPKLGNRGSWSAVTVAKGPGWCYAPHTKAPRGRRQYCRSPAPCPSLESQMGSTLASVPAVEARQAPFVVSEVTVNQRPKSKE